ncbi:YHYH domain-containing protein [Patescibacteria group bacterium]
MKKIILLAILFFLAASPALIIASPGGLDQYGGHYCYEDCFIWNQADGQYHYHHIPFSPDYLSGNMVKTIATNLFYQPNVPNEEAITEPTTLQNSGLIENPALDVSYCQGDTVFAGGRYDFQDNVRIKPVCTNQESIIRADIELNTLPYYKEIKQDNASTITKIYHQEVNLHGKKVYTDRPHISELQGKIIQGETDPRLYYVYSGDYTLKLRQVTPAKAQTLLGDNYEEKILYFDDSIIYSYKIGPGLN